MEPPTPMPQEDASVAVGADGGVPHEHEPPPTPTMTSGGCSIGPGSTPSLAWLLVGALAVWRRRARRT